MGERQEEVVAHIRREPRLRVLGSVGCWRRPVPIVRRDRPVGRLAALPRLGRVRRLSLRESSATFAERRATIRASGPSLAHARRFGILAHVALWLKRAIAPQPNVQQTVNRSIALVADLDKLVEHRLRGVPTVGDHRRKAPAVGTAA